MRRDGQQRPGAPGHDEEACASLPGGAMLA